LWELMIQEVLRSRVLHTDDTTVPLQDPVSGQISTARFWNYLDDQEQRLEVFEFTDSHERKWPARFLANYRGYLQADAYNGYDGIYLESGGSIIEVGCWQHARKRYKWRRSSNRGPPWRWLSSRVCTKSNNGCDNGAAKRAES